MDPACSFHLCWTVLGRLSANTCKWPSPGLDQRRKIYLIKSTQNKKGSSGQVFVNFCCWSSDSYHREALCEKFVLMRCLFLGSAGFWMGSWASRNFSLPLVSEDVRDSFLALPGKLQGVPACRGYPVHGVHVLLDASQPENTMSMDLPYSKLRKLSAGLKGGSEELMSQNLRKGRPEKL